MFELFGNLVRDEKAIKEIFDHFKNLAGAAVIIAVGAKILKTDGEGFFAYITYLSGGFIVAIGCFLALLNERRGMYLLTEAKIGFWPHLAILVVYGMSMSVIVERLVITSSAFK